MHDRARGGAPARCPTAGWWRPRAGSWRPTPLPGALPRVKAQAAPGAGVRGRFTPYHVPVIQRLSTAFIRTLREDPADAEVASHRLLVRACYIRRAAPGVYTWLPLGLRTLRKIEAVVRQEMDAMGAQEVHFPALLPAEPYQATGRWEDYGPTLFKLRDRKEADYLLAPTHEEMFTLLVKDLCSSYKDLPLSVYQIQTKYRDEARPRAGIIRGREFVMKDSYSFDLDEAGLEASYQAHRAAYQRIFTRLGLDYVIVSAVSGAMGGSRSEEFLHPSPIGEDTFVRSDGGYAANAEAVTTTAPGPVDASGVGPARVVDTPDTPTIESLVDLFNKSYPRSDGSGPLHLARGIEIGHIFALGRKYADALGLRVLDENGRARVVTMGSYGIGVSRVMAALAEANHDEAGLAWPIQVAPYHLQVLATGKEETVFDTAQALAQALDEAGFEILYDDRRRVSAGVKFKDSELLGVPYTLVVGRDLGRQGTVELRDRRSGERVSLPVADAVARVSAVLTAALAQVPGRA